MFGLRMPELLLILAIVVILFGATKLPQLGAGLGQSIRGFKKALGGGDDEEKPAQPAEPAAKDKDAPKA
jgi:sec-independent protein translocase protein TatA